MSNASDFGFTIDGQLPSVANVTVNKDFDSSDWRTISNAVFASKEARKSLPEMAISQDVVSLLATRLGVTWIDAAPLVEVLAVSRTKTTSNIEHVKALRSMFGFSLVLATRIFREIERIEALIDKGKAMREDRYWTFSFALFDGKRVKLLIEKGDYPTFDTVDWQNKMVHEGASLTGGQHFIGTRAEALAKAASLLVADHYEIEVIG